MAEFHHLLLPKRVTESVTQGHWSVTLLFGNGHGAMEAAHAFAEEIRTAQAVEAIHDGAMTFVHTVEDIDGPGAA